jgi:hypothetical protein
MERISKLQTFAVGLGTSTYSTISAAFTRGLPVSSFNAGPGKQKVAGVPEIRNKLEIIRVTKGPIDYDASLSFPLDVGDATSASIGDFLGSIFGTDTGSVAGGVFTHLFTVLESSQPSYLNLFSTKDAINKQFCGFVPTEVKITIKITEGLLTCDVSGFYQKESDLVATQTVVYSGEQCILPSQVSLMKIAGTTVAENQWETCTISIKRDYDKGRFLGTSRNIADRYGKNFTITVDIEGIEFADDTERAKFVSNTASSFQITLTESANHSLDLTLPTAYYTAMDGVNLNNEDVMKIKCTMLATGTAQTCTLKNVYPNKYSDGSLIS